MQKYLFASCDKRLISGIKKFKNKSVHAIIQKISRQKKDKWPIKVPNFTINFFKKNINIKTMKQLKSKTNKILSLLTVGEG